jgi:hypothetical protein
MSTLGRKCAVVFKSKALVSISGPKSPMTTKKAMHVPSRKPIMLNSTASLPVGPNVWNAGK